MCQSRDFPTELCCNTIIHLLFHCFYCIDPYFIFKLTIIIFKLVSVVFVVAKLATVQLVTALLEYIVNCIRVTVVLEYLKSAKGCAASYIDQ